MRKMKRKMKKRKRNIITITNGEMNSDEIEERKKNFLRTIKNKSGWSIALNIIVGLVFSGYFIQMNLMHNRFELGI